MKRLWPVFCAPKVRSWVLDHVHGGTVERLMIATNAPWSTLRSSWSADCPRMGWRLRSSVTAPTSGQLPDCPAIRDADISLRITGRTATVNVGRGVVELASGRKLTFSNGVFEIPDTDPEAPPARARFRIDGPVQAAAELLALERLRDHSGLPIDPATSRGNFTGQVTVGLPITRDPPPGATSYTINVDVAEFRRRQIVMGQKVEAAQLKVAATNQGYQIRGDVGSTARRLRSTIASRARPTPKCASTTLDEAARTRSGLISTAPAAVRFRSSSPAASPAKRCRFTVDADLTQARIDNLMPGWVKPAGKPTAPPSRWSTAAHALRGSGDRRLGRECARQ